MKDLILYAFKGGNYEEYLRFEGEEGFIAEAEKAGKAKSAFYCAKGGECGSEINSAEVFLEFVAGKKSVAAKDFKKTMRALRRFDEVGISNELHDALEEISDSGEYEAVALASETDDVTGFEKSDFSAYEI